MSGDRILTAIALRLASVALFAVMNALIKLAEDRGAALPELLFFRQFGALLLLVAVIAAGPGLATIRTQRFGAHVLRAAIGASSMICVFGGLVALPLAEATTLGFTLPIFATILGVAVLGEPTGWRRWAAVLAGFAGVVIVARPSGGAVDAAGAALSLCGAFLAAIVAILLRSIGKTERPLTTVFWFSALSLVPFGVGYAASMQPHPVLVWALLFAVGLVGGAAQIAMTSSLRLGPVSVVVPMDYTALLWATLLGWLAFGMLPAAATWTGAPIIIGSGLYIVWREHVRRRTETPQALSQGIS